MLEMSQKSEQILQSKTTIYQIRFSDHKAMKDGATMVKDTNYGRMMSKAELLQEGIFFLIHIFARDVLDMKKSEIEKN